MADDWRESTLENEVDILLGLAFKSTEFAREPPGHRLVRGDNIKRGTLEWGEKTRYWRSPTPDLERYSLRAGDVVVGMDGSRVGENSARIAREDLPALLVQRVACLRAREHLDQSYLRYLICNPGFTAYVKAVHTGTSIPHISGGQIGDYPIWVPPVPEQRAIAHVLGTLDDKIELNRRMSGTLETMARALFRSWFVDFDPVRAKAEGRHADVPAPLADLFPSRFIESDLGETPETWSAGTLADFSSLNPEVWTRDTRPSTLHYVDLSNTKWGRVDAVVSYSRQDAPSRAQRILRPRDTIIGTVRPGNGSYAFVSEDGLTGSTGFAVLRPLRTQYAEFVYLAATAADNIDALSHVADGAAYPAVRPEVVAATLVVRPADAVLTGFSGIVQPLFARTASIERESRTLTMLRDALLPKLISGEIRLKDAERIVEAAT